MTQVFLFIIVIIAGILIGYFVKTPRRTIIKEKGYSQSGSRLKDKYQELLRKLIASLSDNYSDIDIIEEGGMGIIASAYDKERHRKVAIKTILPELKSDPSVVGLFLQECQVIQSMNHPNVVRIFEVGKKDFLYYVMDFLEGETLQDMLDKNTKLDLETTVRIGSQVARALQHIHSNALIHRDIKPSNIFVTAKNCTAKIIDFGIAKMLRSKTDYAYGSAGSPIYASPEQIRAEDVTGKSDIYSLGVTLFYMLTGEHPFNSTDLLAKMFESPKNIKDLAPDVPDSLAHTIRLCINSEPASRLPAHELWARLRAIPVPHNNS